MSREPIRHAVWPTGVPPVTTALWRQADWDLFAEGFRPHGYTGNRFDLAAYAAFAELERFGHWNKLRAAYGLASASLATFREIEAETAGRR